MVSKPVLALLIVLLAACSSPGVKQADVPPATSPQSRVPPPQAETGSGAVSGLLAEARSACDRGDYNYAQGKLQRAQRVAPRDARVYAEYVRLYQRQGEDDRAVTMAERGMLYCEGSLCAQFKEILRSAR